MLAKRHDTADGISEKSNDGLICFLDAGCNGCMSFKEDYIPLFFFGQDMKTLDIRRDVTSKVEATFAGILPDQNLAERASGRFGNVQKPQV
jgi:hypothetical protein